MHQSRQRVFLRIMLGVVLANYLAQIPYDLHLYYFPHQTLFSLSGSLLLSVTLLWFFAGYLPLTRGSAIGYWLLLSYLLVMVTFYLFNVLIQVVNGFNPLFFLRDPDPLVGAVLAIGHVNMVAGICFLAVLIWQRQAFLAVASPIAPNNRQIGK